MTRRVVATSTTTAEILEAYDWYEGQRPGLGETFLAAIDRVEERIIANPFQFPVVYRDARRASMRRFPYVLLFRLVGDDAFLLVLHHSSRHPRRWQARVRRPR